MSANVQTAPKRKAMSRDKAVTWTRWGIIGAIVVFLEIYGRFFADPAFMQPVSAILKAWFDPIMSDPKIRWALALTIFEIGVAYGLSIFFGFLIGVGVGSTNLSRKSLYPIILLLYAVPQVSLMPLVVLFFGLGAEAKIFFGFSHGIFPIIVNVVAGMRNVSQLHMRAASSMGATRAEVIRHVLFPNMVPAFFVGLRLAMTLTLLGVILAELYVSTGGIGYFTRLYAESYNPAPLFALIGTLAIIAVTFNELVRIAERRLTPGKKLPPTKPAPTITVAKETT